jgi:hypothetical protein
MKRFVSFSLECRPPAPERLSSVERTTLHWLAESFGAVALTASVRYHLDEGELKAIAVRIFTCEVLAYTMEYETFTAIGLAAAAKNGQSVLRCTGLFGEPHRLDLESGPDLDDFEEDA